MLIGIDATKATAQGKTGVEKAAFEIILNLRKLDKENNYLLYTSKHLPKDLLAKNFSEYYIPFPKFWHTLRLPLALYKTKPDIYFSPSNRLPSYIPKKAVASVYDLASKYFPSAYSQLEINRQNAALEAANSRADAIIFDSQSSLKDFEKYYPAYKGIKKTIYLSFDDNKYKSITSPQDVLKLGVDYILFVGRLEARKNIKNIIKAFGIINEKYPQLKLVLAGKPGSGYQEIRSIIEGNNDIIVPGYIDEKNLPDLYARAKLFLFPTLYEGFGIPILEAMACGTPVVASNISSMPEVAGEAAVLVNPQKPKEIANACIKILGDKKTADKLASLGLKNIKRFFWSKTAKELLEVFKQIG